MTTTATNTPRLLATIPVSVRWSDLDALNHVNNSVFLIYFQEARLVWLSQIEGPWRSEAYMPVLATSNVNYRRQLEWPGQIVVELYCTRLGNSSITVSHRVIAANEPEKIYADGDAVIVWIEPATGNSIPLPDVIREACQ